MQHAVSLSELQEHLQRVIALNFPEAWWVRAEIAELNAHRGHRYLELVEKGEAEGSIVARASAVLWQDRYRRLERSLRRELPALLQPGMQVLLQVEVVHHPRYGLSLHIRDVDPAYTLGEVERRRRQVLDQLREKGLLDRNGQLPLRPVLQRLAVLSSPEASGLQDFLHHLHANPFGYRFQLDFFPCAVQGERAVPEIVQQIDRLQQRLDLDAVLLLRGGGSRLDLATFDQWAVAEAIARCHLPVLTGIGHETDTSAADWVAHTALKTPTALADFLLRQMEEFEERLRDLGQRIHRLHTGHVDRKQQQLTRGGIAVQALLSRRLASEQQRLAYIGRALPHAVGRRLDHEQQRLHQLTQAVHLLDPDRALQRGYTLTTQGGLVLRSVADLDPGRPMVTHFRDGTVTSRPEQQK